MRKRTDRTRSVLSGTTTMLVLPFLEIRRDNYPLAFVLQTSSGNIISTCVYVHVCVCDCGFFITLNHSDANED